MPSVRSPGLMRSLTTWSSKLDGTPSRAQRVIRAVDSGPFIVLASAETRVCGGGHILRASCPRAASHLDRHIEECFYRLRIRIADSSPHFVCAAPNDQRALHTRPH